MTKRGKKTKKTKTSTRRTRRNRVRKHIGGDNPKQITGINYKSIDEFFKALTDLERSGYKYLNIYYHDESKKIRLIGENVEDYGEAQDIITETIRNLGKDINTEYKYFYVLASM